MTIDTCLRLVLPHSLEEQVVDHLLRHPAWVGSFTTVRVDGHGALHSISSNTEQVRGRAGRVQIEILMAAAHCRELIAHLKADLPNADIRWWTGPVLASGDFS